MTYESVDRIRRTHRNAKPDPAANPAWANCHLDCGVLLERIAQLESMMRGQTFQTPDEKDARIAQLEVALREYGAHRPSCPRNARPPGDKTCTCGLHELLAGSSVETKADSTQAQRFTGWVQGACELCGKSGNEHIGLDNLCPPRSETNCDESTNPGGTGLEQSPSGSGDGQGDSGLTPGGAGDRRVPGNPINAECVCYNVKNWGHDDGCPAKTKGDADVHG